MRKCFSNCFRGYNADTDRDRTSLHCFPGSSNCVPLLLLFGQYIILSVPNPKPYTAVYTCRLTADPAVASSSQTVQRKGRLISQQHLSLIPEQTKQQQKK